MKFGKIYFVIFFLFCFISNKVSAQANWQLVIIPQGNIHTKQTKLSPVVYSEVTNAVSKQLVNNNFTVFDQSLLNLNNCINLNCEMISDNKLLSLAQSYNFKSQQLAINLAIVYQIEAFEEVISKVKGVRFKFSSYLVDLDSGERVESYSDTKRYTDLAPNCKSECFNRWQEKKAYQLAQDAGYILALKINRLPKRYRYEFKFNGFNINEFKKITASLNLLSEKKSHISLSDFTIKKAASDYKNNKHISLTSRFPASEINQRLQKEFTNSDLKVLIDYRSKIKKFTIVKIDSPVLRQLIFIFLVVIVLATLFYYIIANTQKKSHMQQIKQAITSKEYYLAYSILDKLLKNKYISKKSLNELSLLREKLDTSSVPLKGNLVADKALSGTHFFIEKKLNLGRRERIEGNQLISKNQVALGYQYIGETNQQNQFIYKNNYFYILDQESKYGSQYNGTSLSQGKLTQVETNSKLILASKIPQELKACQLNLYLSRHDLSALVMNLNNSPLDFLDSKRLASVWPDFELDLNQTWVMLGGRIAIGIQENGKVDLGCINGSDALVYLSYDLGYFIEPIKNQKSKLKVNKQITYSKVPVIKGAIINIYGVEFSLG